MIFFSAAVQAADVLQSYHIDSNKISVSGVSSGGYMAAQLGVAYSQTFMGVGSVAGGIYWCAKGDSRRAQTVCMNQPEAVKVDEHLRRAQQWELDGAIDPLANVARQKVFLFASPQDFIIRPLHTDKLAEFYGGLGAGGNVLAEKSIRAAHGFPTLDQGNACGMGFSPWLLKCNYDAAGEMLKHFHGALQPRGTAVPVNLKKFSQAEFDARGGFFFANGWIYVPTKCAAGEKCALHVALHGCQMNPDYIQDKFVSLAGYNEWAETNNIVVLYPQSAKRGSENPYACWDWFGFGGADYSVKTGVQMSAIKSMIDRISGH